MHNKKTISLLLAILCAMLCACSGSTQKLKEDDFLVYLNGEAVYNLKESGQENTIFSFAYNAENEGLLPEQLETKRGTRLGQNYQQLAQQYSGVPATVYSGTMEKAELDNYKGYSLDKHGDTMANYPELLVLFELWVHNGKLIYTRDDFVEKVQNGKILPQDDIYFYDIMVFLEQDEIVNISIMGTELNDKLDEYKKQ